jgi:FAD:protein FMN transferase
MKVRCQALLGTLVEISVDEDCHAHALEQAFKAIELVHHLMSFYDPLSELNQINRYAHIKPLKLHPWTIQVLQVAKEIHERSAGLFNCGVGHRLVEAGLLPRHLKLKDYRFGGLEHIECIGSEKIQASQAVCLDLGGIAKGFAVDKAVEILQQQGVSSGCVNAGGDLRVFGAHPRPIQIRQPSAPQQLIEIGTLRNGAIATSALYYARRDQQ